MGKKILTINLGTTSTRLSICDGETVLADKKLYHPEDELKAFTQKEHVARRKELILAFLAENSLNVQGIDAIALRAASLPKPVLGGTYAVEGVLREDLAKRYAAEKPMMHGTDIVLALTDAICEGCAIPYYVVDPASQNNMIDEAKVTGHPMIEKTTTFHALNQKYVAHVQAEKLGKKYEECNFVVAHLGGGISVCAHQRGRVTDTNDCTQEGPFSSTRAGSLPNRQVAQLCFSGKVTFEQFLGMTLWQGGVSAYLGTSDMREVEARADAGDEKAALIFRTVAYRTAKEIGSLCAVTDGDLDGIILTGGMSNSKKMCEMIAKWVGRFAPVSVYPGEMESEALAAGVLRILNNAEPLASYSV